MALHRRKVLKGIAASGVSLAVLKAPYVQAQAGPMKVGFLTIKTGPLASGGLQMEQGLTIFLKERNNTIAGRQVELHTADTAANPAQARTKTQELVERLGVSVIIGPLAAFEALAIDDYIKSSQTPILTVAGAEDMTQRKANPWLVRASATSSQPSHPVADYASYHSHFHTQDVNVRYVVVPFDADAKAMSDAAAASLIRAIVNPDGDAWY